MQSKPMPNTCSLFSSYTRPTVYRLIEALYRDPGQHTHDFKWQVSATLLYTRTMCFFFMSRPEFLYLIYASTCSVLATQIQYMVFHKSPALYPFIHVKTLIRSPLIMCHSWDCTCSNFKFFIIRKAVNAVNNFVLHENMAFLSLKSNRIFCTVSPSSLTPLLTPPHLIPDEVGWGGRLENWIYG